MKTGGRKKEREKRKQKEIARGIKKTREHGVWIETEKSVSALRKRIQGDRKKEKR